LAAAHGQAVRVSWPQTYCCVPKLSTEKSGKKAHDDSRQSDDTPMNGRMLNETKTKDCSACAEKRTAKK
jgi:hypothetical protein